MADGQDLAPEFNGLTKADLPHLTAGTFDTCVGTEVSRQAQRELLATGRSMTREWLHKARGRDMVILNTIIPMRNAEDEVDRIAAPEPTSPNRTTPAPGCGRPRTACTRQKSGRQLVGCRQGSRMG